MRLPKIHIATHARRIYSVTDNLPYSPCMSSWEFRATSNIVCEVQSLHVMERASNMSTWTVSVFDGRLDTFLMELTKVVFGLCDEVPDAP